jgi:hypothetical protein
MIRYFCDNCAHEIRIYSAERMTREFDNIKVQISVAWMGVWNSGHLCNLCIIEAVTRGIDIEALPINPPPVPTASSASDPKTDDDVPFGSLTDQKGLRKVVD